MKSTWIQAANRGSRWKKCASTVPSALLLPGISAFIVCCSPTSHCSCNVEILPCIYHGLGDRLVALSRAFQRVSGSHLYHSIGELLAPKDPQSSVSLWVIARGFPSTHSIPYIPRRMLSDSRASWLFEHRSTCLARPLRLCSSFTTCCCCSFPFGLLLPAFRERISRCPLS